MNLTEVKKFIKKNGVTLITPHEDGTFECEAGYEVDIAFVAQNAQLEPYTDRKSLGLVMPEISGDKYLAYVDYEESIK